ncbi:MAG: hypothetical protein M0Z33_08195 [Actinomycetota bacterium]|nr:hypothetical protein [Actinomycetota bacterium]
MSARPRVFEGPDLEKLLVDAWGVHGTGARIGEPTRVRTGGVLGFFQKLQYRIEVLPAEPVPAPESPPSRPLRTAAVTTTRRALEELVDATEDVVELGGAPHRSFDEVLDGVASALGDEPESFAASGISGLAVGSALSADLVGGDARRARDGRARREAGDPGSWWPPHGAAREQDVAAELKKLAFGPTGGADLPGEPASGPSWADARGDGRRRTETRDALASLGFAEELLDRVLLTDDLDDALAAACALLPVARPLPDVPGALVAVVGELGRCLELAGSFAEEMRLDDPVVAIASPGAPPFAFAKDLHASDARSASALSPGWRRDRVALVAVSSGTLPDPDSWCRPVLRALRPSATIASVSATAKPEDLAELARRAGGFDALAVDGCARTVTPAAVTRTRIPVARLDDLPATAARWSALLTSTLDGRGPGER